MDSLIPTAVKNSVIKSEWFYFRYGDFCVSANNGTCICFTLSITLWFVMLYFLCFKIIIALEKTSLVSCDFLSYFPLFLYFNVSRQTSTERVLPSPYMWHQGIPVHLQWKIRGNHKSLTPGYYVFIQSVKPVVETLAYFYVRGTVVHITIFESIICHLIQPGIIYLSHLKKTCICDYIFLNRSERNMLNISGK